MFPIADLMPSQLIFTETILILRTYAFTGGKKVVLAGLSTCLAVVVVYQLWVGATQSASACASFLQGYPWFDAALQ